MKRYRYLPPVLIICVTLAIVFARNLRTGTECYSESAIMMDTIVEVNIWGRGAVSAEAAASSAFAEIARVESIFGDGIVDSKIAQEVLSSHEFEHLMDVSTSAHRLTSSQFDPTIGSVSRLWHFWDGAETPDPDTLREALEAVGFDLFLAGDGNGRFIFDVGGIAKGYAVDRAADRLRSLGFKSAIVNAGGDMRLIGRRPDGKMWRIAIRHPRRTADFVGYLDLEDAAVATSGDYEKYFVLDGERYHHILNPVTGMPGRLCESVTVVAESACLGDALATGLFLVGSRRGLDVVEGRQGIEAVFVSAEGESILVSSGLSERFGRFEAE